MIGFKPRNQMNHNHWPVPKCDFPIFVLPVFATCVTRFGENSATLAIFSTYKGIFKIVFTILCIVAT